MLSSGDTIFAPATGSGQSAIAVIRVSGPAAHDAVAALTGRAPPAARRASLRHIRDISGDAIDAALVLTFDQGESYTGEPMAEIQCHGGRAVLSAICERLGGVPGCRMAVPGEFTRRAFQSGRMDLCEVEGLGDLIAAETDAQRRQAVRLMSGELSRTAERWRTDLLKARALLEVTIDWADEEVPEDVTPEVREILERLSVDLERELARSRRAERIRAGFEVAIIGGPNAGKSTLLNALAGRDAAITSEMPGTTRDVIEVIYDLDGLRVVFLDTAGLRAAADAIEAIGVAHAARRAKAADLRICLASADAPMPAAVEDLREDGDLMVWSKSDLGTGPGDVAISARTGAGIGSLLRLIRERLEPRSEEIGLLGHLRQQAAVEDVHAAVQRAREMIGSAETEVVVEELRAAARALEVLTGRLGVEDMLDVVFGSFCLGK